jgi:hypothetical protein
MANAVDNGEKLDFIRIIGIGINNCSDREE